MDGGEVANSPLVDKELLNQSDELVDITAAQRHDQQQPNPDVPSPDRI